MKNEMKELIEKQEELIDWLEIECQSPETADLSHSFAENLMIKLAEISYIKLKQEPEKQTDCIHFDCAQGRNKCCNDKVKSNRCIADCGEFQGKESQEKDFNENFKGDDDFVKLYNEDKHPDKLIKKLKELIELYQLKSPVELGRILKAQISALEKELKTEQCHNIFDKVKEANTPDKRTFKQAEAWSKIESDFILWDNETRSSASQRQILDWFKLRFEQSGVTNDEIEKQLLNRFGFTDDAINAGNQLKIFSFMDWLKSKL